MAKRQEEIVKVNGSQFPQFGLAEGERGTVNIKGAIPGQTLRVRVRKKKTRLTGEIVEILEQSPIETETPCPAFGRCGGCLYQTLSYEEENKLQQQQLKELYGNAHPETKSMPLTFHPSPKSTGYRNKMEYSFGDEEKTVPDPRITRKRTLLLHSGHGRCNIAPQDFETIRSAVQEYFDKNFSHYHKMRKEGFLRYLMLREGGNTKEILVNLYTSSQGKLDAEEFTAMILSLPLDGKVTGILHTVYDGIGDVTGCDEEYILYGKRNFTDRLLGLDFEISPYSFFQTNSQGAELLYSLVLDFAGDFMDKTVFDLYSGIGTMAQIFAKKAKTVEAVEIVEETVMMAKENATKRTGQYPFPCRRRDGLSGTIGRKSGPDYPRPAKKACS